MLCKIVQSCNNALKFEKACRLVHSINQIQKENLVQNEILDTRTVVEDFVDLKCERKSVLEKCEEDISHVGTYLAPTFNFAAYINKSETLQKLLDLGVNFHKLEKKVEVPPFLLQLDYARDIEKYITFFQALGLQVDEIANTITKNPFILKEDLESLNIRINYLTSKKFKEEMILRILQKNPYWLNFSTQKIDTRLAYFQKNFTLTGDEVRFLAVKKPRIITYSLYHITVNKFVINEEMGFTSEETKDILIKKPQLFMKEQKSILKAFEYVHKDMAIPLEVISQTPEILTYRQHRIKQRHLFLKQLNRLQFDPKLPNYIPLMTLVSGSDSHFSTEVAKSSIQAFNEFLKSL